MRAINNYKYVENLAKVAYISRFNLHKPFQPLFSMMSVQ
jgi:hypothetical protein